MGRTASWLAQDFRVGRPHERPRGPERQIRGRAAGRHDDRQPRLGLLRKGLENLHRTQSGSSRNWRTPAVTTRFAV